LRSLLLAALVGVSWQLSAWVLGSSSLQDAAFAAKVAAKAKPPIDAYTKRPQNAYMHYASEKRPALLKKGMAIGDVGKTLGAEWRGLSAAKRKPYDKLAADDRKRFEKDLKSGMKVKERKSRGSTATLKVKKVGPKKPRNAYIFYMMDKRSTIAKKGMSPTEVMKAVAAEWAKAKAPAKKKYQKMADEDKQRYESELLEVVE